MTKKHQLVNGQTRTLSSQQAIYLHLTHDGCRKKKLTSKRGYVSIAKKLAGITAA